MNSISLIDETFNSLNAEHYYVTLQILPESISFSVLDSVRKKYILLKNLPLEDEKLIPQELSKLFESEELFQSKIGNLRTIIFTEKTTIVPTAFSSKDNTSKLLSFNFGENVNQDFQSCKTPFEATLAYSIPNEIVDFLSNKNCTCVYPLALTLLSEAFKISKLKDNQQVVIINFLNYFAQVAIVIDGKLMLFNIFPYKAIEDLSYFIVYLYDLFNLDKEKVTLSVSGITEKNDKRITHIQQFIKEVQFSKTNSQYIYSYRFNEIPQHHFSNHFILPYEDYKR
jgi:hypothetical protein